MRGREHIVNSLLVLKCQQGDGAAFADLVARWQARLHAHARRLTGDTDAAGDVVQDAWVAVVRGIARLDDADAFPAWIFRIVTNKSRDWVRKQARRRKLEQRYEEIATRGDDVPNAAHNALQHALEELSVNDRALLNLHYIEGFSMRELAEILQIPEGTVKSRMHHARERVRRRMEVRDHE